MLLLLLLLPGLLLLTVVANCARAELEHDKYEHGERGEEKGSPGGMWTNGLLGRRLWGP